MAYSLQVEGAEMKSIALLGVFMILAGGLGLSVPASVTADQLLDKYFAVHKSLASDSINGVAASAAEIARISRQAAGKEPQASKQLTALSEAAAKLNSTDLKSARNGFGELSERMIAYLKASGTRTKPFYQFYCPMVKRNWLQPDTAVRNPYYGSEMPKCGELVQAEKPTQAPMEHHH